MNRRDLLARAGALGAGLGLPTSWARAQSVSRAEGLRVLSEGAPNSFDSFAPGVNRQGVQLTWNVYDRLVKFASKPLGDGTFSYDYFDIRPELAKSFEISPDRTSITFRLREDATFHDGSPVTAEDVKFSLDRVVASPIGLAQFRTGSMSDPKQFVVLDPLTIRIDLPQPDRFALPNLALIYPIVVNARLARQNATPEDPFGSAWIRANPAGGGAYKVARVEPGRLVVFERFDGWRSGPPPQVRQVVWQTVPSSESRVASLVRGDADVVQDLPPKDVAMLAATPKVKVVGMPTSAFHFIGMNTRHPPFDRVELRRAIAHALPYRDMFKAALFERGEPLFGGDPGVPRTAVFPQPGGYDTDLDRAKALLAEAGLAQGMSTTFSYDSSNATIAEPIALLVQESLGKIGIEVTIEKVPAGRLGTLLQDKKVPFYFESSAALLADPDYFFRIFYSGETRWNFGSYSDPDFQKLVEKTRYETDRAVYEADVKRMIGYVERDIPIILLWHPWLDIGLGPTVSGYSYTIHRQLDLRPLARS